MDSNLRLSSDPISTTGVVVVAVLVVIHPVATPEREILGTVDDDDDVVDGLEAVEAEAILTKFVLLCRWSV